MPMARRIASAFAVVAGAAVTFGAVHCVTPSDGYDDYINRTANVRGTVQHPMTDAGPVEASLPDGGFSALYVASCLPHVTTVDKALRFQDQIVFTPSTTGPGGSISISFDPIVTNSTTAANTVGSIIGPAISPVDANGQFALDLKNLLVPGAANPIAPVDVHFDVDTTVFGQLTMPDSFCGGLDGAIVPPTPTTFTLDHCLDVCLFVRIDSPNAPLPVYTDKSVFVCPGLPGCS
jgi:hypothetical protein